MQFSDQLQTKIDEIKTRIPKAKLGSLEFDSPLLLAPMSAICNAPFRLLMEKLGAGGTVSELISCHGINYQNKMTKKMLTIFPEEKNVGLQLFGEDAEAMAKAAKVCEESRPKFIDINMGCPVRKVVTKGGGSALLKDTKKLSRFFKTIKDAIELPLTIKIRIGWDLDSINASEVIHIAHEEGVEFVAIHGRTRTQGYQGKANWELLESLVENSPLPLIGNGDLHTPRLVKERLRVTNFPALMLGRGALRNPFLFLESYLHENDSISFTPKDYQEVIDELHKATLEYTDRERTITTQMKKYITWFAAGFEGVAKFRGEIFSSRDVSEILKKSENYFGALEIKKAIKQIDPNKSFMAGGHG